MDRARTRGGFHQQLAAANAIPAQPPEAPEDLGVAQSRLGLELLLKWCWGWMTLPMVQLLASSAVADGLEQPLIRSPGRVNHATSGHQNGTLMFSDGGILLGGGLPTKMAGYCGVSLLEAPGGDRFAWCTYQPHAP